MLKTFNVTRQAKNKNYLKLNMQRQKHLRPQSKTNLKKNKKCDKK